MKKSFARKLLFVFGCLHMLLLPGCISMFLPSTEAKIFRYHAQESLKKFEIFTTRLYAKNPKFESDPSKRQRKIQYIFKGKKNYGEYARKPSNVVLTEAFAKEPEAENDRVYLLGLGLAKSIREAYGIDGDNFVLSGLQIPLKRLELLHLNLSQVNWRLKTYKDDQGQLLFLSNGVGSGGYINMGYEVLMTEVLTMVKDDIYLRGGLPQTYLFKMTSLFASLIL